MDGDTIQQGIIYVAPPDQHMLVEQGCIRLLRGPKENRHRPAIDPLFRSASVAYGPRVVGVVLTGSLDDGTAGLVAIKRVGGIAVVQDPNEAFYPGMPLNALEHVHVDYKLPISKIGPLITRLAYEPVDKEGAYNVPEDMEIEMKLTEIDMNALDNGKHAGTPSVFSCPECRGVLWEIQDGELVRYRCRVGHAFSLESMMAAQSEGVEEALWAALKTLEESVSLSRRLGDQARQRGQDRLAQRFEEKLQNAEQRAEMIRSVLFGDKTLPTTDMAYG
jgi:two-component system chemotaxis response regulator CheB